MTAAGGNFQGPLGMLLPLDLAEILPVVAAAGEEGLQVNPAGFDLFPAAEKFDDLGEGGGTDDVNALDHGRFPGVLSRQDQAGEAGPLGGNRHGECSPNRL